MATIPLRPSLFSLLITLVSIITELGLLSALLRFNTLLQCRHLSRGFSLSIPHHRRRTTLLALFTMLLFVLIELLASANTVTVFPLQTFRQRCTQFSPLLPRRSDVSGAEIALYSCLRVNRSQFSVFSGNHSSVDDVVQCDDTFAFRYENLQRDWQTLSGDGVMRCTSTGVCAIARARGTQLFISDAFRLPPEAADPSQQLLFLPTEVSFNATPHLSLFARRAAEAFELGLNDELDLRRRIIMGSRQGSCLFNVSGDEQTQIPDAMLGVSIAVWTLSVLFFLLALSFRRAVYFDMNNQMHWANRVRRAVDDKTEVSFVKLASEAEEDATTIYVVDKSEM